jgi:hypothetical protein
MDTDLELAGTKTTLKTELYNKMLLPLSLKEKSMMVSILGDRSIVNNIKTG